MSPPLVAHIVFRLDTGGLENGLVNLINRSDKDRVRHAVIALTEATDFAGRIERAGVTVDALHKREGKDLSSYLRLYRLLRSLRPDIVHTRNIGTMDCQFVAWLARVPVRVHGEHGWDVHDPHGSSRKYRWLRRCLAPIIHRFVTVSADLRCWLTESVGIAPDRVTRICNGVDTCRYHPPAPTTANPVVFGTVSRLSEIKDPLNTIAAFLSMLRQLGWSSSDAELLVVGDGPLMEKAKCLVDAAPERDSVRLMGNQPDVASWLNKMDVFVLGSRREGISNTILEAMSCGLPVVATRTGGNLELVVEDETGMLAEPENSGALAAALSRYAVDQDLRRRHGSAGRQRAVERFSLDAMIDGYQDLYANLLEDLR